MSSEKLTKKEIREPDQFLKVTTEFWKKAAQHQKAMGIAALAILGVFVIAIFVNRSFEKKAVNSGGALSRALELARRGVDKGTDPTASSDLPNFSTYQEKYETIAAELEKVRADFPGSQAARSAAYYLADAKFQLGKLDEADALYGEYIGQTSAGDPLRVMALEGRGYVAESKKDWAKALELFEQMNREASGDPSKARAALHRARILAASGKKQEAAEAFQKIQQDFKEDPAARQASERLALLAGEGIHPPAAQKAPDASPEQK